jgi:hypothetical protein
MGKIEGHKKRDWPGRYAKKNTESLGFSDAEDSLSQIGGKMKHYIVPYIVAQNGNWWGGVDLYNHSEFETNVMVNIQRHSNGTISNTMSIPIKPWCHHVIGPDQLSKGLIVADEGRATVFIDCSDDLYVTTFMGRSDGLGVVPHYEVTDPKKS